MVNVLFGWNNGTDILDFLYVVNVSTVYHFDLWLVKHIFALWFLSTDVLTPLMPTPAISFRLIRFLDRHKSNHVFVIRVFNSTFPVLKSLFYIITNHVFR